MTIPPLVEPARRAAEASGVRELIALGPARDATPLEALLASGAAPPAGES